MLTAIVKNAKTNAQQINEYCINFKQGMSVCVCVCLILFVIKAVIKKIKLHNFLMKNHLILIVIKIKMPRFKSANPGVSNSCNR